MPTSSKSELDTRVLDNILKNLEANTEDMVAKMAFTVEGRTKINIQQMEAIDTGALLNSVYTAMQRRANGVAAMAQARALNPEAGVKPLPMPDSKTVAHVGPSVEYAMDVHFGSGSMPGRPYLLEAVRATEKEFYAAFGKVVTDGK